MNQIQKKIKVLCTVLFMIAAAIIVVGNVNADERTGTINFTVSYVDAEDGSKSGSIPNNEININLVDYNDNSIDTSTSANVIFDNVVFGNYIIDISATKVSDYIYKNKSVFVTLDANGDDINSILVERYHLNHTLNVTVNDDGNPANLKENVDIDLYTDYNFLITTGITDENGTFETEVPIGEITVKVEYDEGGNTYTYITNVNIDSDTVNLDILLNNTIHVWGFVKDFNENPITDTTITMTVLNVSSGTEEAYYTQQFSNGEYDIYLNSSSNDFAYYVTADGYNVSSLINVSANTYPLDFTLEKEESPIDIEYDIATDFTSIDYEYIINLKNSSRIDGMIYSDIGSLYYQLMFAGYDNTTDLQTWYENSVRNYTSSFLTIGNYVYELSTSTVTVEPIDCDNGFDVTIEATYNNGTIDLSEIIEEDGSIVLGLNIEQDADKGAYRNYSYSIILQNSSLERVNEPSGVEIEGYVNDINITSGNGWIDIVLTDRKAPELTLNLLDVYWEDVYNEDYVINASSDNYTILVPANVQVSFNASDVALDIVRDSNNWEEMSFLWTRPYYTGMFTVDNVNMTQNLTSGVYIYKLTVMDIANNVNSTEITVYADGTKPDIEYTVTSDGENVTVTNNKISINESATIVFNATATTDTIDGTESSFKDILFDWNIEDISSSSIVQHIFDTPTRGKDISVNLTVTDNVGNNATLTITVEVLDITEPEAVIDITNETGVSITDIDENEIVNLSAYNCSDSEDGSIASYKWSIQNEDGEEVTPYTIESGNDASEVFKLSFTEYGMYTIELNITDDAGNYDVVTKSLYVIPVKPDLKLNDVNITETEVEQGTSITIKVNITNNGNADAGNVFVVIIDAETKEELLNVSIGALAMDTTIVKEVSLKIDETGQYDLKITIYTAYEPEIYISDNFESTSITVKEASWKDMAVVAGVIIALIAIGFVYYKRKESSFSGASRQKKKDKIKKSREKLDENKLKEDKKQEKQRKKEEKERLKQEKQLEKEKNKEEKE